MILFTQSDAIMLMQYFNNVCNEFPGDFTKFQQNSRNSSRTINSSRFPGFPGLLDTLKLMTFTMYETGLCNYETTVLHSKFPFTSTSCDTAAALSSVPCGRTDPGDDDSCYKSYRHKSSAFFTYKLQSDIAKLTNKTDLYYNNTLSPSPIHHTS